MQNAECKMQNEQRLIAYEAVYQYAFKGVHGGGLEDEDFNAIINAIDSVPTVDAVEVVRCKDCKFYELQYYASGLGMGCTNNKAIWTSTPPDAFCSYGERREGE